MEKVNEPSPFASCVFSIPGSADATFLNKDLILNPKIFF